LIFLELHSPPDKDRIRVKVQIFFGRAGDTAIQILTSGPDLLFKTTSTSLMGRSLSKP